MCEHPAQKSGHLRVNYLVKRSRHGFLMNSTELTAWHAMHDTGKASMHTRGSDDSASNSKTAVALRDLFTEIYCEMCQRNFIQRLTALPVRPGAVHHFKNAMSLVN